MIERYLCGLSVVDATLSTMSSFPGLESQRLGYGGSMADVPNGRKRR